MIDLLPDEAQQELLDTGVAFLDREVSRQRMRQMAAATDGFDASFLTQCGKLGWFGLALDEEQGGSGLTLVEEILIFRELGRRLVPGPFLATTLAARVAAAAGKKDLAERLSTGEALAGLAEVVSGEDRVIVWEGGSVDYLLLADVQGHALSLLEWSPPPERLDPKATIDPSFHISSVGSAALPAAIAAVGGVTADLLLAQGQVLISAMLVGIAEQVRDDTAAYTKDRIQFGKPIGAFQAVKHRCADMAVRAEMAWAQTVVAALRLSTGSAAPLDVAAAKTVSGDAAVRTARDGIQNFGGIGYTSEQDVHLFLKRAHMLQLFLGGPAAQLETLVDEKPGW